ncbi:MAG: hypothetical protein ACYSR9_11300 [Planctomycetota bacterium]|jgi:hypothetical protein
MDAQAEQAEQEVDQEIDLQELAGQEQEADIEQEESPQMSAVEQKAYDQGWRPEDDFKGPSENWKTPREYIQAGEHMQQINALKSEFNERIENVNRYNTAQTEAKIKELKLQQRATIEEADTEAYDKKQVEIDALNEQQAPQAQAQAGDPPEITAWKAKNTWFNDQSDERGGVAVSVWNNYLQKNPNATNEQALAHVDSRIQSIYPTTNENPRRDQPNVTESNTRRPSRKGRSLSMSDLTNEERGEWNQFGSMMFTEAEFLKAASDKRKTK